MRKYFACDMTAMTSWQDVCLECLGKCNCWGKSTFLECSREHSKNVKANILRMCKRKIEPFCQRCEPRGVGAIGIVDALGRGGDAFWVRGREGDYAAP